MKLPENEPTELVFDKPYTGPEELSQSLPGEKLDLIFQGRRIGTATPSEDRSVFVCEIDSPTARDMFDTVLRHGLASGLSIRPVPKR